MRSAAICLRRVGALFARYDEKCMCKTAEKRAVYLSKMPFSTENKKYLHKNLDKIPICVYDNISVMGKNTDAQRFGW